METVRNPGNRRSPCLSDLFQPSCPLRSAGSILLFCYLLSPPVLLGSCRKLPEAEPPAPEPVPVTVADSVLLRLRADAGGHPVRRLDLFVYSQDGTQPLLGYARYDGQLPDTLALKVPKGTHRAVGIANSPHNFNLNALGRFDAMEKLTYGFSDDDPAWPVLGGTCGSVRDTGTVRMTPLLCRIVLASVANTMDGYELLESPRIRIRDIPDTAEILREEGFRPSELIDAGPWAELPCDIGYFPQEPGTVLWCYPNDTPENVLGTPRPFLEFECRIRGESCSFEVPLPALPRGCTKTVELTIDGPDSYDCRIR